MTAESGEEKKVFDFDFDKHKEEIKTSIKKNRPRATGSMTREACEKVLLKVKQLKDLKNDFEVFCLVTGLVQRGGTNRNAGMNVEYTFGEKSLSATEFQKICREESSGTARQFARTMCNQIWNMAAIMDEEGDLAKQMRLDNPNLSREMAYWCSNFQSENSNCDPSVREWLKNDAKRRFNR